jgi:hypothetical protein
LLLACLICSGNETKPNSVSESRHSLQLPGDLINIGWAGPTAFSDKAATRKETAHSSSSAHEIFSTSEREIIQSRCRNWYWEKTKQNKNKLI